MRLIPGFIPVLVYGFIFSACNAPAGFTERRVIIGSGETVRIDELKIAITNKGCGRKWVSEDRKPTYEAPYCDLEVKYRDSTLHFSSGLGPFYAGAAEIRIDKMNPWGREEDSIPPGGCRIIVNKVQDTHR